MSIIQSDSTYHIIENLISQSAIRFPDSLDDNAVDKIISIASTGLSLKRDILTTAVETIITALEITDVNTGDFITIARLTYLKTALEALTVPSDATTCNFNDAIQLQDYNATLSPPATPSEVKIGSNPSTLYGMNMNTTTANSFIITGNTGLTANITNDITLSSVGLADINLDAPNINSYTFAMPICFTRQRSDTFSYTLGLQQFENVYTTGFNVPFQFFSDTPQVGYTSTNWKIDFALNTWNNTVVNDKGLACYFVLQDTALNFYTPITYNSTTPYVVWIQPSLYNDGTNNAFQNFNWSDYVDFSGLVGGGSGILPLDLILVFAADSAFDCSFSINVSLTRTNVV